MFMELYRCQNSIVEFEMQQCNPECKHSICNPKLSFHEAIIQFKNADANPECGLTLDQVKDEYQ